MTPKLFRQVIGIIPVSPVLQEEHAVSIQAKCPDCNIEVTVTVSKIEGDLAYYDYTSGIPEQPPCARSVADRANCPSLRDATSAEIGRAYAVRRFGYLR